MFNNISDLRNQYMSYLFVSGRVSIDDVLTNDSNNFILTKLYTKESKSGYSPIYSINFFV